MQTAISTQNLTKRFSSTQGVFELSFSVNQGQIFGFLGPNGAGKTTLIRLLLGYLRPDSGSASLFGESCTKVSREVRHRIGYLPAEYKLYEGETGWNLLRYLARYRPEGTLERAKLLAETLELSLDGYIKHFSKGMKQKLALIQALMHDPDLLILDEPTDGFDPLIQEAFHRILLDARDRGKTVFLSSHVLSEVETVCDQVGIIRGGHLLAIEGIEALKRKRLKHLVLHFKETFDPAECQISGATLLNHSENTATFSYQGVPAQLLASLSDLPLVDFTLEPAHLDEVFMEYYR